MHFVAIVPLGLAILYLLIKAFVITVLVIIAILAYAIYAIFFKKEKQEKLEEEYDDGIDWDKLMEKQEEESAEFYRRIGRMEQKLDDVEEKAGLKKRSRK